MRYSGDWMVLADDRILEYLNEEETGTPKEMGNSELIRYSRPYISQRCGKLVDHGLLQEFGNGVYQITDRGKQYLEGELDTHVDRPDNPPEIGDTTMEKQSESDTAG